MVLARMFSCLSEEQIVHNYKSPLFELSRRFGIQQALVVDRTRNGSTLQRNDRVFSETASKAQLQVTKCQTRSIVVGGVFRDRSRIKAKGCCRSQGPAVVERHC